MNTAILKEIKNRLPELSRSEHKVAEWLLAHPRLAIDAPLNEVADSVGVSEPTVIRFCRTMGLGGFRDLKTNLIAALQQPESFAHHDVSIEDSVNTVASKVLESSVQALVDLRQSINGMPFEDAIDRIKSARQIIFTGLGASGYVARDAAHKFFRLGIPCSLALDSQTILQQAAIAEPDDVFIAISHTGTWEDLVTGMTTARANKATVIALTAPEAPLAAVADLVFACHPPEDTNVFTPMSSRLAQLTILDAVQVTLAVEMGTTAENKLRQSKAVLLSKRQQTN